ncbi:MAG TPA: hypothetical protein VKR43_19020, partial [Bryobacteraceae bacterium]|nr:hypothetical protein [Bryobacteraceae bacterium]
GDIAGTFEAQITTGRADQDGYNVFSIAVGNVTVGAVAIQIDNSGATSCSGSSAAAAVSARRAMAKAAHVRALQHPRNQHKPTVGHEDR